MQVKFNLEKREFKLIPEGERVLEITKAECTPSGKPNKMKVSFKDLENEGTCQSTYSFDNDGAMFAMAMLCQKALELPDMDTFDTMQDTPRLIGKQLVCEVTHTKGTKPNDEGEFPTFANIKKVISLCGDRMEENEAKVREVLDDTPSRSSLKSVGDDL